MGNMLKGILAGERRKRAVPDEGEGDKSMASMGQSPEPGSKDFIGPVRRRTKFAYAMNAPKRAFDKQRAKMASRRGGY